MKKPNSVSIITIGDELLIGQTIDTNSAWIAQQLNPMGFAIQRRVAIGDHAEEITNALDAEIQRSTIVFVTGGLGPTSDDITKPTLCSYFGGELKLNEEVLHHIENYFKKRNRVMLESNTRQAWLPDNCIVLFNEVGTAAGMYFQKEGSHIFSLPGVPFEMKHLIEKHIIPILNSLNDFQPVLHRTLLTAGIGESFLAEKLKDFEAELPGNIKLAYLPSLGMVKLRLSSSESTNQALDELQDKLASLVEEVLVTKSDTSLEQVIFDILKNKNISFSIAESCTGGHLAARFTALSGISNVFRGGMIPYLIETKENVLHVSKEVIENHGVVSSATVKQMADQSLRLFGGDIAIAITGYLEKNDHDNEVWIGVSTSSSHESICIHVPYDREKNTLLTVNTALNFFRKCLLRFFPD